MSKIQKALEKAQRERWTDYAEDFSSPLAVEKERRRFSPEPVPPGERFASPSDQQSSPLFESGSLAGEQFRKLRTHLLRLNVSDPPKTIMVTSATSGEGKTFVSFNLAAGIAHDLHAYALLVDCDLRKPDLDRWLNLQNGRGLSDYLMGRGDISDYLKKTEVNKLSVLPSGNVQENPTELIGSQRMENLIQELKTRYSDRYIILDSTPLLATSEPEILSRFVDGILIVVRAGVTPRETLQQAISSLDEKKILGFVLNDLEFKSSALISRYFGSNGTYYKYGYGYGGDAKNAGKKWRERITHA